MIPGVIFSGSVDGHLRAYSARDGAVIAGGMVFIKSGYAQWGGMPGNVLLAYSVNGR
jgi:polyvinyl alcohol dehydrogenase (cytochrome)